MSEDNSYQWRLRCLGAFLDTQVAASATALEVKTGFAVRYYRRREAGDPLFVMVEMPQLRAIGAALHARRAGHGDGSSPQHPGQFTQEDRYQDLFRALGWELDDLHGTNVVIDERNDGMYLAYRYLDPTTGLENQKRFASLGIPECEAILSDARQRRGSRPRQLET